MEKINILFEPPNYIVETLPQICGDMTEWVPVNMHPMDGMEGMFTFSCEVAKGFKFRFWFVYRDEVCLSNDFEISQNKEGLLTNSLNAGENMDIYEDIDHMKTDPLVLQRHETYNENKVPADLHAKLVNVMGDDYKP